MSQNFLLYEIEGETEEVAGWRKKKRKAKQKQELIEEERDMVRETKESISY